MRLIMILCGMLFAAGLSSVEGAQAELDGRVLAGLVEQALEHNPELQAARERWEMARHRITPAGSLDDPTLGLALSNYPVDSLESDRTPMTGNEIRIAQNLPFPGKLEGKEEVARQQSRWFEAAYRDARLQVAAKVKDTYYRLYFLDRAVALTEENVAILDSFIELTMTRYEVGSGLQQDVLKAQVEQSKLEDKLLALRQQSATLEAQLVRLLGGMETLKLPLPDELPLVEMAHPAERLKTLARDNRPMFASYRALIERYEEERELARLDYYPNFNVWTSYRFRDDDLPDGGTDFVSAGVGINLPIWREKRSAKVAEADAGIRLARRQQDDFAHQVDFTIADALAGLRRNHDQAELYQRGIIPQAQQSLDASTAAYQVGKVELLTLLDGLMTLYRYQIDFERASSDALRDLSRLEAATGTSLLPALRTPELVTVNGPQP